MNVRKRKNLRSQNIKYQRQGWTSNILISRREQGKAFGVDNVFRETPLQLHFRLRHHQLDNYSAFFGGIVDKLHVSLVVASVQLDQKYSQILRGLYSLLLASASFLRQCLRQATMSKYQLLGSSSLSLTLTSNYQVIAMRECSRILQLATHCRNEETIHQNIKMLFRRLS